MEAIRSRIKRSMVFFIFIFCFLLLCTRSGSAEEKEVKATNWIDLKNGWEKKYITTDNSRVMFFAWISDEKILLSTSTGFFELDVETLTMKKDSTRKQFFCKPYCDSKAGNYQEGDYNRVYYPYPEKKHIKLSSGKKIDVTYFKKLFPKREEYRYVIVYGLDGFVFADPHKGEIVLLDYDTKVKKRIAGFQNGGPFCYRVEDGEGGNALFKPEVSKQGVIAVIGNCEPEIVCLLKKKTN